MDEQVRGQMWQACQLAVERAVHKTRRDEYHERFPVGECPLCTPAENLVFKSRFRERILALREQMGTT